MASTILVVEDDACLPLALRDVLEDAGFRVIRAGDGKNAVELFHQNSPDLVLSGISMPLMDGYALLAAIRKTRMGRLTPFVFHTAH